MVLMGAGETGEFLYTPERPGVEKPNVQTSVAGWQIPVMLFIKPASKTPRTRATSAAPVTRTSVDLFSQDAVFITQ
ncbi:MAG: hypothetical protein NVSMB53_03350 [Gemmatimonadaceae bacterium]